MSDVFSKIKRSWIMAQVKGRNTKPEILVRSIIHKLGFRFRNIKYPLPGNPDIVLPKYKAVVFVHGCFWHQHSKCRGLRTPKSNLEYWVGKLQGNVRRDADVKKKLRAIGWKVIVVWECELKDPGKIERALGKSLSLLKLQR
jgi:DNA mismatch endonuclease (patch repair protein)